MSLSFKYNNDTSKSYLKLEIYKSQIFQNIKVPLPYGLSILLDNFPEKYIEPITKENEIFQSPENKFIFYLNNNNLSKNNVLEKEFIINSYTTSIIILRKNFASVKIPILFSNKDSQRQWFFLKDINDNICIKILVNIEIHLEYKIINNLNLNNLYNILKQNSETIKENKIKLNKNKSNINYINSINDYNTKYKNKNIIKNHNTYVVSTNYKSSSGNSFLNITNNIYMKAINNNSNNINNLNITFPFNFSPISYLGKSNSFFIDSLREKENNLMHINKNSFSSLNDKSNNNNLEKEELKLISENDFDSATIKDNDICSEDLSNNEKMSDNNKNVPLKKENYVDKINNLISEKNEEIINKQKLYSINYNNYLKDKKKIVKKWKILEKENDKLKNNIKMIEKSKQIYETKSLNLNDNLIYFSKMLYRNNIQNELNEYEGTIMSYLNNISFSIYNIEKIKNQSNKDFYNDIELINKKIYTNKIITFETNTKNKGFKPIKLTHKNNLNFTTQTKGKIEKGFDSNREIYKKYSPYNFNLEDLDNKLKLNISNSENLNDENNRNNHIDINKKTIKNYTNKIKINDNKFKKNNNKKYHNIFRDYYYDTIEKKDYRKKPSKSNLIKGKLKLKMPLNENSVNNIETKYLLTKNNFNKLTIKASSINTSNNNNISNKTININKNKTKKKKSNLHSKKTKSDKYSFKSKYINNNYLKSNGSIDQKFISVEKKSMNGTFNYKISTDRNNNLCKKKLNKKEKYNYNKKSFNNETFRNLYNNNNYFKGKPILISNNNIFIGKDNSINKKYNNTDIELNKKKNGNMNNTKVIRRKTKNKTVKINLINNDSYKKKKEFRNSMMPGAIIMLNLEKNNKNKENNEIKSKNKTLKHTYSKPIGISINNNNYHTINNTNFDIIISNKDKKYI